MDSETILLTGSNGYVGLHVIEQCLARSWAVVGTVRSEKAAQRVRDIFPAAAASSQLSLYIIADMFHAENFKLAFEGARDITAVIHTASPLINNPQDTKRDVIDPSIQGATTILEAVARFGQGKARRIVHTSSCAAVLDPGLGDGPGKTYGPDDWNPMTYEAAASCGDDGLAYMASKGLSEKAMWAWMEDNKPLPFDLVSVAPTGLFGPHQLGSLAGHTTVDLANLNISSQMIWAIADATAAPTPWNSYHLGGWADVRDAAASLVAAVAVPEAGGQRFLCGQRCSWHLVRDTARKVVPELAKRIEPGKPGAAEAAKATTYNLDGTKVTKILGVKYMSMEDSLRDSYAQLLEAEKKDKA